MIYQLPIYNPFTIAVGPKMQVKVRSADVRYEANFALPAIDLVSSSSSLLRSVFSKLAPRYTVRSDDVRITNSPVVSEYRLTVDLFNRNAQLLVTADKAILSYKSLATAEDIHVVMDSSAILLACVKAALTETRVAQESISLTVWFTVDDEAIDSFQTWKSKYLPQPQELVAAMGVRMFAGRRITLQNPEHRWTLDFCLDQVWRADNEVLFTVTAIFDAPEPSFQLEEKVKLIQDHMAWLFPSIGLTVVPKV